MKRLKSLISLLKLVVKQKLSNFCISPFTGKGRALILLFPVFVYIQFLVFGLVLLKLNVAKKSERTFNLDHKILFQILAIFSFRQSAAFSI